MNPPVPAFQMTTPVNGPPPFYSVSVSRFVPASFGCSVPVCAIPGPTCPVCGPGSNITNLNYGISNLSPWNQCLGGDCRNDAQGYNVDIPASATPACGGAYASVPHGSSNQGVIFTGDSNASFGSGQASASNWVVGGSGTLQEVYAPPGGSIPASYSYYQGVIRKSGITPTVVDSVTHPQCGPGGLTSCDLSLSAPSPLPNGVYQVNGDLTLTGPTYTFTGGRHYVFLVNGNLRINTRLYVDVGSTVTFAVTGDIHVNSTVGQAAITGSGATPADPDPAALQGFYVTDRSFIIEGQNNFCTSSDSRLNVAGVVIVNAGGTGGRVQNNRDLCAGDASCPTYSFISRPDLILNAPDFLKKPGSVWQELTP